MEIQFILRLPDTLKDVDPKECSLTQLNQKEVIFKAKGKSYPGLICKIPTVVESQKMVDNKIYKIADISTLVVIYDCPEKASLNMEEELFKLESSGLTPPLAMVKERKFEKNTVRSEEVEKIEKMVSDLLAEDAKAIKVEVITNEKESTEMDLDSLAADLENELRPEPTENTIKEKGSENTIKEKDSKIATKEKDSNTPEDEINKKNALIKGSQEFLYNTKEQVDMPPLGNPQDVTLPHPPLDLNKKEGDYTEEIQEDNRLIKEVNKQLKELIEKDSDLTDLKDKIKEKTEQFEKSSNPILKKRFEQALNVLKEEYNSRVEQIKNKHLK